MNLLSSYRATSVMIESLQRVPGLLLSNRKCESPECSVAIVLCLQLKLHARKPLKLDLQLCQSQTVLLWPHTDRLSLVSPTHPNITQSDWTSWALRSERNALIFCMGSVFGVSIHYPHQTSNAWCVTPAETCQRHYVYRKQRCLVNFTWLGMLIVK